MKPRAEAVAIRRVVRPVRRPSSHQEAPRGIQRLLVVIGLYMLFPAGDIPFIGVSLSAPLLALLFLEMARRPVRWGLAVQRPLIRRALILTTVLLLSWAVNLAIHGAAVTPFELVLGLRLPYWVFSMVLVAVAVGRTRDPGFYLRVLGWGIMAVGALRLGAAVFGGMWKVGHALALTQNAYGLLFSTFWPFALVVATSSTRYLLTARMGLAVLFMAVVINGSRGSWVTVLLTTALFLFVSVTPLGQGVKGAGVLLATAAVLLGGTLGLKGLLREDTAAVYAERARTFENLEEDSSYQIRVAMRRKALALFRQSPVVGVGPGQFSRISTWFDLPARIKGRSLDELNRKSSHSAYFQLLAETGVAGTLAFVALVAWLALRGWRAAVRLGRSGHAWPLGFWLGFVGMSVHLLVIAGLLGTLPWFVYGLVGGAIAWERWAGAPSIVKGAWALGRKGVARC